MDNTNEIQSDKSFHTRRTIILTLILLAILTAVFFWFRGAQERDSEARMVIAEAQQYLIIVEHVDTERKRCNEFIASQEGNFGEFEYCQKFLDWADTAVPMSTPSI